ncbi:unnamed protein product [Paramecium sonneborni]|uniref:Uncharacterized protein n=1 Tax=Paramecium sonneborni TaxID=65129 RepID=A0A8S1KPA7_9CILI|nr:unnamed protein product [Paramecium sonneborni]
MKNIILRFNYISVPFQRIQKLQYNFCLSNQDVRQNINKLIELNEQQLNSINEIEKETLSLQIATIENNLEIYLQSFLKHQKQPYYLFRKNLIQLAFYTYYNSKFDLCQKYISYATLGDYENTYSGELMKQLFLAELYGIQFRINYNNQELQLADKSLVHWQNIIENHSKFYKEIQNNQTFDQQEFFENMENVHFHQYIETLIVVGQLLYNKGLFIESFSKFDLVKVLIKSLLQFIDKGQEQQQNLNVDNKEYQDFYIKQLRKLLSKSYINQIKIKILMNDLDQCKQLYQEANELNNTNVQTIQLDILNFDIQFYQGQSDDILDQIQSKIEQSMTSIQNNNETKDAFLDYYQFRIKYNLDSDNFQIQLEYLSKINCHINKIIEINHHSIQQLIYNENYNDAFLIANQQYQIFDKYQITKQHFIYQFSLAQLFFLCVKLKKVQELKQKLNQFKNEHQLTEIDKLFQFYEINLEFLEETKKQNEYNILEKMKNIEFQNNFLEYLKHQILEMNYEFFKMKDKQIESLVEQLKYLRSNEQFNKDQIEQVKQKIQILSS